MRRGCRRRYVSVHRRRRQVPRAFDDVWILRLIASPDASSAPTARWVRKTTTFAGPGRLPQRSGATATAVGRMVYVFGGQDPSRGTCFNDVVVLDCDDWSWSRLPIAGASPPPRNAHVACAADNGRLLVIHGGSSPEEGPWATSTFSTSKKAPSDGFDPPSADKPLSRERCTPPPPFSRAARTRPPRELLILGGRGRSGVLSDVAVLNLDHMAWTRRGHLGRAVCAHTAVPWRVETAGEDAAANAALVFGGFDGARCDRTNSSPGGVHARHHHPPPRGWTPTRARGGETDRGSPRFRSRARAGGEIRARVRRVAEDGDGAATAVIFPGVTPGADLADARAWSEERDGPAPAPASDLD